MARIIHTTGLEISGSQFSQITGSLTVTGSTELLNPDQTITLRNTSGSTYRTFGTDGPGVFLDINQNDTGLGNTSLMLGNTNPNIGAVVPITGLFANYITGSDGASGSVSFFTGQRDFTGIGGQIHTLISMEYEPGKLLVNNDPEVSLKVGEADTNNYRESIDGRYINRNTGETAQLTIGETDSTNAQQVNIKNVIIGTSGSFEVVTNNKSPNTTFLIQGMISESGETGLSYDGKNYNQYTNTTSSFALDIGDIGFNDKGPSYVLSYAKDTNNFNDQNTEIRIGHSTNYAGTVNISEYRNNFTASIVGFFTGSAGYDNQQAGALPFVIFNNMAGVRNSTSPAFVIEQTFPVTGSTPNPTFRIDHNGNISKVGDITSTGTISTTSNISASGFVKANNGVFNAGGISIDSNIIDFSTPNLRIKNTGLNVFGGSLTGSIISASGDLKAGKLFIDEKSTIDSYSGLTGNELTLNPEAVWDAIRLQRDGSPKPIILNGNITGSGHGLFQAGKPITSSLHNLSASLGNAGFYHIVGGNLTCSISASTAPIGAEYEFFQTSSAGNFLFETGSGITLISKNGSLRLAQQGSSAVLKKVSTTTFHLMGDLT